MYHGDIALADTIDVKFTTVNSSGVPTTLAGSPVVSAYVGNGTTEITAGITLSVDFDGRTGLHNVRVVASGANGFAAATNVQLVITTGTVDGNSVVGYVIASFSIQARSAATPAQVNAEMLDAFAVDTHAQPGQGAPAATTSYGLMLRYCYKFLRNQVISDSDSIDVYADDGVTVDHRAAQSDVSGTYTRGKFGTGA